MGFNVQTEGSSITDVSLNRVSVSKPDRAGQRVILPIVPVRQLLGRDFFLRIFMTGKGGYYDYFLLLAVDPRW